MARLPHLDGISCRTVQTPRGAFHVLEAGDPDGAPVVLVHGNVSSATFWEEVMLALPAAYRAIAYDQRGYGESQRQPIDATRGVRDLSDDLEALAQTLGLERFHLIGHSMGGNVVMQYAIDHPDRVRSLTLVAPGSPYGFGGTKDLEGTPCWPDYAGSGGGLANPEFVQRLAQGDRGEESPVSPRNVFRQFYGKPPLRHPREDVLVEAMLTTATGEDNYPGDAVSSPNWPGVAPGTRGILNALSPKYLNQSGLAEVEPKPPLLWIRGDADQIVSDESMFEFGTLGKLGLVPGWPGEEVFPPQPMIGQTRAVLERYRARGGTFQEVVLTDAGHSPYLEKLDEFMQAWLSFLEQF